MLPQDHEDRMYEFVRARARDGLASLDDARHSDTVLALFGSIGSSMSRALADMAEEWNSTTLTCRLPVEILVLCFSQLDALGCVVTSSHVCRHWRRSAVNEPSLWTRISIPTSNYLWLTYLRVMLERSRAAPLTVTIRSYAIWEIKPDLMAEVMLRTQDLTLAAHMPPRCGILSLSAPLLEHLHCAEWSINESITIPEDLFAGNAKLRSLDLARFSIPTGSDRAVSVLRTVRTWSCALSDSFDFGLLFRQCPNLESLTVLVCAFDFAVTASCPNPRSLSCVHIRANGIMPGGLPFARLPDFSPILAPVGGPSPACIEFSHLKALFWPMKLFLDHFSYGHKWSMTVRSEDDGPSFALAVDSSHSGTFTLTMAGHNLELSMLRQTAPLLSDLSVLRIAALPLKRFIIANLTLPSLIRLDIDVPPGGLSRTRLLHRNTTDSRAKVLSAPLLQHLVVRPVEHRAAPRAWTDFFQSLPSDLRRWLRYDAEKLQEIVLLQGALPTPINDADLARLQPLAEVVCINNAATDGSTA